MLLCPLERYKRLVPLSLLSDYLDCQLWYWMKIKRLEADRTKYHRGAYLIRPQHSVLMWYFSAQFYRSTGKHKYPASSMWSYLRINGKSLSNDDDRILSCTMDSALNRRCTIQSNCRPIWALVWASRLHCTDSANFRLQGLTQWPVRLHCKLARLLVNRKSWTQRKQCTLAFLHKHIQLSQT